MIRLLARRSRDVTYFTQDRALELEGLRDGEPGWWLRGEGVANDPRDVERVLQSTPRAHVVGYDVIVAAPRTTSLLLAVDSASGPGLVAAHRVAVRASLAYLEERALVVRDRRGGLERDESKRWERVVGYTHGLNRHGEPHLHDHVLVGARPEQARTVLDARALYAHASAADALYRSTLRYELGERTPWRAWRSFDGVEHVVGLDEGYRALWSGHHRERGEKLHWTRAETEAHWERDAAAFEPVARLDAPTRVDRLDEHRFAGALEGRLDVARRHVVAAWADAATYGQDPRRLLEGVDALYPRLREGLGVHERSIGVREARLTREVREHGPRPLDGRELDAWRQRSRERDTSREGRSR